jgi:hypothetical protein
MSSAGQRTPQELGKRRAKSSSRRDVQGYVSDLEDLFDILRLAHWIAVKGGRVVNEIELMPIDDDGD